MIGGTRMIRVRNVTVDGVEALQPIGRAHAVHNGGSQVWAECRSGGYYPAELCSDGVEWVTVTARAAKFLELGDCLNCYRDKRSQAGGGV